MPRRHVPSAEEPSPLRRARLARNWTLEDMVEEIDLNTPGGHSGVTPSMVSSWELGRHLAPAAAPLLVVAFDAPFYGLAARLAPHVRGDVVVVVRSTAVLHAPDDPERNTWEHDGLHATTASGGRVAAISGHMRRHLATSYDIEDAAVIDLPNGLTRADWRTGPPVTNLVPARGRAGFILAMGRAALYKGFYDLLDALALLKADSVTAPHAVIAAVTDNTELTPYQRHLASKIAACGLDATLVTRFDPLLRSLLAASALAAVVVSSRAEPFGRIPLEAFAAGAALVVSTTAGGLAELVSDGHTGYTARPGDPASLAGRAAQSTRMFPCRACPDARRRPRNRCHPLHLRGRRSAILRRNRAMGGHAADTPGLTCPADIAADRRDPSGCLEWLPGDRHIVTERERLSSPPDPIWAAAGLWKDSRWTGQMDRSGSTVGA